MAAGVPLAIALVAAICGVGALRFAWSRPRRSLLLNAAGWGLLGVSALAGASAAGAWGVAVAGLWAMGTAMLLLAHATITAPAGREAKASNRRVGMLPQSGEPLLLARRITTFMIVALVAMVVSTGLALAARALVILSGAGEADAIVAALFMMPLIWALLAYILLMQHSRARQWRVLALLAVPGLVAFVAGGSL